MVRANMMVYNGTWVMAQIVIFLRIFRVKCLISALKWPVRLGDGRAKYDALIIDNIHGLRKAQK